MKAPKFLVFAVVLCLISVNAIAHNPKGEPFVLNKGQWEGPFSYKVDFNTLSVFAESNGFSFVAREAVEHKHDEETIGHEEEETVAAHAFRLRFDGAAPLDYTGVEQLSGYYNYFLGNDKSRWQGHVPLFHGLTTSEIYPGISLEIYSESGTFKYDYKVSAGANAGLISFKYTGLDGYELEEGKLILKTSVGDFVESIPESYQFINGEKVNVRCEYNSLPGGSIGFAFPNGYDSNYPLVIDPILVAATLSGTAGFSSNYGHGAAFDNAGNIYTHAISFDSDYPTDEGSFQQNYGGGGTDAVISKLNPDGSELIYATFIGGSNGEYPHSTIVNLDEEIYVFGITSSSNFPTSTNAFQTEFGGDEDIFITGISADGSELVGSTYLGGSGSDGRNQVAFGYDNYRGEINLNLNGEVYLSSCSSSENFPTTEGVFQPEKNTGQDAVVLKMTPDLSGMIWSTFLGSSVDDMAYGIRIKDDQTVYVSGAVGGQSLGGNGGGFTVTDGAYQTAFAGGTNDGFITRISEDGSTIVQSTFLGETNGDRAYFLDFDNEDNVWVYMQSSSSWDVTDGVWGTGSGDVLVHKLSSDLSQLLLTSYLSQQNSSNGTPVAFMVDLCNAIYISAFGTSGGGFEASDDALFSTGGFYVGVYSPEMSGLEYGTYYTGSHVDGGTSRFDKQGIVYQGVCSGGGFNTTDGAWAEDQTTGWDIGVFKIDFQINSVNAVASAPGQLSGCAPHEVNFQNFSEGEIFIWDFANGTGSEEFEPTVNYDEPGEYLVSLVVIDSLSCNFSDTVYIPIQVFEQVDFFAQFEYEINCENGTVEITDFSEGPADMQYEWDMGDGTILTDENPVHVYAEPGEYTVTLTLESDACNESVQSQMVVEFVPFIQADFQADVLDFCDEYLVGIVDDSDNAENYSWDMGNGVVLNNAGSFQYVYSEPGTYTIQLIISSEESCEGLDTAFVDIEIPETPVLDPQIFFTQDGFCEDLVAIGSVEAQGAVESYLWELNDQVVGESAEVNVEVSTPGIYTIEVTVVDAVCNDVYVVEQEFEFYDQLGYLLPPNLVLCYYDESIVLDATVPHDGAVYNWNNGASDAPTFTVFDEGDYTVDVLFNGCIDRQSTSVDTGVEFPLAFESEICENQSNIITFPVSQFIDTVYWDNGQSGFSIEVFESGYYPFVAIDVLGCEQVDSLFVFPIDDDPNLQIPNVFTPNGDGRNDVWQVEGDTLIFYDVAVFNRWGRTVFASNQIYAPWDGTNEEGSGEENNEDTFMYILKYRDRCDQENQVKTGNLTILR